MNPRRRRRPQHATTRRSLRALSALFAISIIVLGCAQDATLPTRKSSAYVERADQICRAGRDRLRAEPRLRDSTVVLADMERQLRALGRPPPELDAFGPDVIAVLARITWAAESFNEAGRYELDDTTISRDAVEAAGFLVCGTP
jgi:hypothetical protein